MSELIRSSKATAFQVCGKDTDIHCTTYQDQHFVLITQLPNFGTWVNTFCKCYKSLFINSMIRYKHGSKNVLMDDCYTKQKYY